MVQYLCKREVFTERLPPRSEYSKVSKMLDYDGIDGWCAGCKVSGITETALSNPNFPSITQIMKRAAEELEASCILVSCNEGETRVLKWLKGNKFTKGPVVRNWGHGGRRTWMFTKKIPKKIWKDKTLS